MRAICFYFQIHQPFRLQPFSFFDIGHNKSYYDEKSNFEIMRKVAEKCYLPTNYLMLDLIKQYGNRFKITYSISGTALDQFEMYAQDVLDSFKELAATGCVEFLSETFSHSLSSVKDKEEFLKQVDIHREKIKQLFGVEPTVFRNTELIYSDKIGEYIAEKGYKAMLTEGAKQVLGWKSPNLLYCNPINPKLKVLLKNFELSDDIAFRFSNQGWAGWPLTAEKYVDWLNKIDENDEIINLFMDYETFGEHQWKETGIFDFLRALPEAVFKGSSFQFQTPSEVATNFQPVSAIHIPYPISWADVERDLTAWLGNEYQDDAFNSLYKYKDVVKVVKDPYIQRDWLYLQTSDHFYYMCTKWFADGEVHKYFNPYGTPQEAFLNYMNILSDFIFRLEELEDPEVKDELAKLKLARYINEKEEMNKLIDKYGEAFNLSKKEQEKHKLK